MRLRRDRRSASLALSCQTSADNEVICPRFVSGGCRPVTNPIVIIGAGGFGREVLDVIEAENLLESRWEFLGFLDDGSPDLDLLAKRKAKLLGPSEALSEIDAWYVIGIGSGEARRRIDEIATSFGREPATLVHPSATIGSDVEVGAGSIICAQVGVTTHIRIGRHSNL